MPAYTPDPRDSLRSSLPPTSAEPAPRPKADPGGVASTDAPLALHMVVPANALGRPSRSRQALDGSSPGRPATVAEDGAGGPAERNQLLRLLAHRSRASYERLADLLESVELKAKSVLYEPGEPITHVYFPGTGACSIVKIMEGGARVEVGTVGCEGMVGLPVFLGAESTPTQCFIQVAGSAQRVSAAAFRGAVTPGGGLHAIVQRYAQYLFDQAAQSVACNRLHEVEERCARWLLMTHDRVHGDAFELTHEFLSYMLGVRRASVSIAAEALQRAGLIHYRRGKITVLDRAGLEAASCECYRTDRADLHRLLGTGTSPALAR